MQDSYETPDGLRIWTAQYLKNKGRCCRSSCLHCPFGHTLSTIGLESKSYDEKYIDQMNEILEREGHKKSDNIALSLLQEISSQKPQIDLFNIDHNKIKLLFLKGFFCGFCFIEGKSIKQLFLAKYFKFQGINKAIAKESVFSS